MQVVRDKAVRFLRPNPNQSPKDVPFVYSDTNVILGGVLLGRWLHNETLLDIESNCIENTKNRIW